MKQFRFPQDVNDASARLRILWIEDRIIELAQFDTLGDAIDGLVHLVCVSGPQATWELIHDPSNEDLVLDGFDAYLTDFRLVDKSPTAYRSDAAARSGDDAAEGADAEKGLFAEAAGFLIGVFVALRFPGRPNVVLPYSGHPEEFGDIWKLVRAFLPASTKITDPNQITKVQTEQGDAIRVASREFRETILTWAKSREIVIDTGLLARALAAADEGISNKTPIRLYGRHFTRVVYLGALFLDKDITGTDVPVDEVNEFLQQIPALDERHVAARDLADTFIVLAESAPASSLYGSVWDAFDNGRAVPTTARLFCRPWLGVQGGERSGVDLRRDAFLIILVYIHARYMLPLELLDVLEQEDEEFSLDEALVELRRRHKLDLFATIWEGLEALVDEQGLDRSDSLAVAMDELDRMGLTPTDRRVRLERLIHQYVDPCPESTQAIAMRILADGRIGKGLQRLLGREGGGGGAEGGRNNRLLRLLDGQSCLPFDAIEVPAAYARQLLPPTVNWPKWLKPLGPQLVQADEVIL